jgi:hypothetical protein
MRRRGDTEKCPACGWGLDPGAYRCPKCRIYFCFKCRARVTEREPQYQCADQSCECYGKLLCGACVVPVDDKQQVANDDATVAALVGGGLAAAASLAFAPLLLAGALGVGAAAAGGYGLRRLGYNVFGSSDLKHEAVVARPVCCIVCRHPVKHLR